MINFLSVIEPINYIPRHKGLGLGAEKRPSSKENNRKRKLGEKPIDESVSNCIWQY